MRVILSYAQIEEYGVLFLTAVGAMLMLQWHVDSWVMPTPVRHNCISRCINVHETETNIAVCMPIYTTGMAITLKKGVI